ncbi:MAG TPA: RibD family protein [Castellaniella sp.]|uniref:RibD family protein n=1 Tax=Castellaniella sp. TaxID=1955812 RepID=UPI002F047C43
MSAIDASKAWDIIRAARRHTLKSGWTPVQGIEIRPGGGWSATNPLPADVATLFDTLLPIACSPPDYVIAQIGQSLDGRIATATGHSCYVTGTASRIHLHRLRALVDAVIVGANTATLDNPQLTVRDVEGDSPARIVIDPNGRVPHSLTLFTDEGPTTWHAVRDPARAAPGARALILPQGYGSITSSLLETLAHHGLRRILVEGGGTTISRFIQAGRVDRLHVVVAPFLIGSGRPALAMDEIDTLDQALRPAVRSYPMGEDRFYDLNLRA